MVAVFITTERLLLAESVSTGCWVGTATYAALPSFAGARGTVSLGRIPILPGHIPE